MRFFIKIIFYGGIIVGGSVLAIDRVPWLKANILEVVNPRIEEGKLVQQLRENLVKLDSVVSGGAATSGDATSALQTKKLVKESQGLLQQIADINDSRDSATAGIITKAVDVLIGAVASPAVTASLPTTASTPAPTPCR